MNTVARILRMAARYRFRLGIGVVCTVIAANFQLLIPQFLGDAVDNAQSLLDTAGASPAEAKAALWWAGLMLLGAGMLRGLFTMIHNYQGEAIGQSIGYELRLAYFEKLQRMSFAYHDRVHSGDLMTRGMLDVEGIRRFVDGAMLRTIVLVILVTYGGYHLISTDALLGMLALAFVPVVAWRATVSSVTLRRTWRALQERMSILTRIMEENLGGIRVVRAFAARAFEMAKFDEASETAIVLAMRRIQIRYSNAAFMTFSYYGAMGLVLWVGGHKGLHGDSPATGTPGGYDRELDRPGVRVRRARVRAAGYGPGGPGQTRRPAIANHRWRDPIRACGIFLRRWRRGEPGAARCLFRGRPWQVAGHRRPAGQRQVDHRPSRPAVLRSYRRAHHHRRPGYPRRDPGQLA
jgi:ABC-type multidrug transport system fused ATPase/permease subunit